MLCKSNPIRDLTCLKVTWSNSCVWLDILAFIDKEKWQKKKVWSESIWFSCITEAFTRYCFSFLTEVAWRGFYIWTLQIHSVDTLLSISSSYWVWSPSAFFITESTRRWKHSSDILVYIIIIESHLLRIYQLHIYDVKFPFQHKRCSSGSRSGCCGDHLRTVNLFVQVVHSWR